MKIAVEGCCHGELDAIYQSVQQLENRNGYKVDVLLICGDFQAVRNHQDLQCMAVPHKYKELKQFHKYYTGHAVAPILTIVIGGNHEASNYMWELYHGGWLAPNIYFLGHAGCVQVNGIRIAGASGIFKAHDFRQGNHEQLPYDASSLRSIYHIREYNIRRLSLLSTPRIFLSHDWPQSIVHHGDLPALLGRKRFLRSDIDSGALGSPPLLGLLHTLKPEWWFAAHLHTRFEARVVHAAGTPAAPALVVANPDEILIEDDDELGLDESKDEARKAEDSWINNDRNPDEIMLEEEERIEPESTIPLMYPETKFLALDKCLPRRQFLEVIDLPIPTHERWNALVTSSHSLCFDKEWLAVTRAFHPWLSTTRAQRAFPAESEARRMVAKELDWIVENVKMDESGVIRVLDHQRFTMTAPGPRNEGSERNRQPPWYTNPQTEAFCNMLALENKINPPSYLVQTQF